MVEKLVISQPLGMVGVFLAFLAAPLLYEVVAYLRTRADLPPQAAAEVVPVRKPRR
jgi:hypothetical protein